MNKNHLEKLIRQAAYDTDLRFKWLGEAKKAQNLLMKRIALIPEKLPECSHVSYGQIIIRIYYPYNRNLRSEIINILEEAGFEITDTYTEADACHGTDPWIEFGNHPKDKEFILRVFFEADLPQSTCRKVKIGEEQKIIDIYEWRCPEDIKE